MNKTIFVFCIAALFIGTTFAGASTLKTNDGDNNMVTINVHVYFERSGASVDNAKVTALKDGLIPYITAWTDEDGKCSLTLEPGNYDIFGKKFTYTGHYQDDDGSCLWIDEDDEGKTFELSISKVHGNERSFQLKPNFKFLSILTRLMSLSPAFNSLLR